MTIDKTTARAILERLAADVQRAISELDSEYLVSMSQEESERRLTHQGQHYDMIFGNHAIKILNPNVWGYSVQKLTPEEAAESEKRWPNERITFGKVIKSDA